MNLCIRSFIFLVLCFAIACTNENRKMKEVTYDSLREPLINANKLSVQRESDEIDQYIKFKKWNMLTTGTGVRYMIYKRGDGDSAKAGKVAKINYKISLLDGTLCYSSEKNGARTFLIGEDHIESGIHEAITYMRVGDKAIVVLPSYMAFGLSGDDAKIPPKVSLVYDIELISLR